MVRLNRVINAASPNKLGFTTAARTKISKIGRPIPNWSGILPADQSPLRGVIFEKYILVFQIQIFGFEYKIQEGLKPDRNNAREGGIVGRDAEGARRGLCAACPPRPRGATAEWRPDRLQWQALWCAMPQGCSPKRLLGGGVSAEHLPCLVCIACFARILALLVPKTLFPFFGEQVFIL